MLGKIKRILKRYTFVLAAIYASLFCLTAFGALGFILWSSYTTRIEQIDIANEVALNNFMWRVEPFIYLDYWLPSNSIWPAPGSQRLEPGSSQKGFLDTFITDADPTRDFVYVLSRKDGVVMAANLPAAPVVRYDKPGRGYFDVPWKDFGEEREGNVKYRAIVVDLHDKYEFLFARDIQELAELEALFYRTLIWGVPVIFIIAIAGSFLFSRVVARRLAAMNETCKEVMAGEFSTRIETNDSGDGFDHLAQNINRMLTRIEFLMDEVRRVSNNVAHDLRTPLTTIRNELALILFKNDVTDENLRSKVQSAIDEADAMNLRFDALLRLTEIEAGTCDSEFTEVDHSVMLHDLVEAYEPIAEENSLTICKRIEDLPDPIVVDKNLLYQALTNLTENAIKYSPPHGEIVIESIRREDGLEITVADTGPGIPEDMRTRVVERFFRMDSSRATPGNGLGLSMVDAIVKLHDATLVLDDTNPDRKDNPGLKASIRNLKIRG